MVCEVCGRPLPGLTEGPEQALLCPACQQKTCTFDRARSYAVYEDTLVRAILLLKFDQIEPLGAWFAERLAELVKAEGAVENAAIAAQSGASDAHAAAPREASAESGGTMGVRSWRFCHTSRQPS
jgi:predicted amidophosphoribosyltransferase